MKNSICIFIFITIFSNIINAQNIKKLAHLDSLYNNELCDEFIYNATSSIDIELLHDSIKLRYYDKISDCYLKKSNFAKSIEYNLKTYYCLKNLDDINTATHALIIIGSTYNRLNDTIQANYYFNEAYKNFHLLNNNDIKQYYYYSLSGLQIKNKKYNDAYNSIITGLKLNNKHTYLNYKLGDYYIIVKKYKEAIKQYELTLALLENDSTDSFNKNIINRCYSQLSTIYIEENNITKGKYYLSLMDNNILNIEDKYNVYINLYKKVNNADSVYFYSKKIIAFKDSINILNKSELSENLNAEFNAKYNVDKYKHEVELKNKQRVIFYIIIGICLLVILMSVGAFLWIKQQKRVKENLLHIVEEKNKEVIDSINYAQGIQQSILPINNNDENCFILFKPKDIVSGDFYWITEKDNKKYYAVVDCTGHGVPGALLSMLCSQLLTQSINQYTNVKDIVEFVKNELQNRMDNLGRNDSFEIGLLMTENNNVEYYGIKRPLYVVNNIGELQTYKPENDIIKLNIEKDTMLYITTDGYIDQFGGDNNKKYGSKNFRELLLTLTNESINIQKELLNNNFISYQGKNEQIDDVLVLGLKI